MVTIPSAVIALHADVPCARAGCRADVPAAALVLSAASPVAHERRSAGPTAILAVAYAPSVRAGWRITVPAAPIVAAVTAPEAMEIRPRQKRFVQASSTVPLTAPPSWEPWLTDGTAYVVVEEREYIDTWESIAETAISEAPNQDILSARIPLGSFQLFAPAVRGGGSVAIPSIPITLVAAAPQGIGRPRRPIIQIIAS